LRQVPAQKHQRDYTNLFELPFAIWYKARLSLAAGI